MPDMPALPSSPFPDLAAAPALIAGHGACSLLTPDGELLVPDRADLPALLRTLPPPLLVHAPATLRGIGLTPPAPPGPWLDLLELFLFCHPGRGAAPTPRGLAIALQVPVPARLEADLLPALADTMLETLRARSGTADGKPLREMLSVLRAGRWPWAGIVADALDAPDQPQPTFDALRVWRRLPKWEETAPRPAPGNHPVAPGDARTRLRQILGPDAETRPGQADFASVAAGAFDPREDALAPNIVLAEAGTGTGKTLGYVAPASLWAEMNGGAVWISTYTRHLQRQIDQELRRLYPDPAIRRHAVVVRKGRENYLCLLNMEDSINTVLSRGAAAGAALIPLALLSLWAEVTNDGDLSGGDLPGWFGELFGRGTLTAMADRRGECIHGACPHYQTCFVEHTIRRAREADLVIANHALVMSQAAWSAASGSAPLAEDAVPTRYVFDEGHHVPDAADSAFATTLSGLEAAELRRWLLGAEGSRSRARGLRRRLEDLVATEASLEAPMDAVLLAARALPAPGWATRLADRAAAHAPPPEPIEDAETDVPPSTPSNPFTALLAAPLPARGLAPEPAPDNPTEVFLAAIDRELAARLAGKDGRARRMLGGECDLHPVPDDVLEAAAALSRALGRLSTPLHTLIQRLQAKLEEDADALDSSERARIEALVRTITRRAIAPVDAWTAMLDQVPAERAAGTAPTYVDFIRADPLPAVRGASPAERGHDIGLHRHWLDPMAPFAATMQGPAHGMLITSATLRDQPDTAGSDWEQPAWRAAEMRLGMPHFAHKPTRAALMSPFDYAKQTRAFVVTDVARDDPDSLAAAYRELFLAAGGGALGLFTAISRLRAVQERIRPALEAARLPLYAQHVDAMDNATLVDVFRTEPDSCLLGTDAMRDGVDVPGRSLRLVVFERLPWPRPDILHRERRLHLSRPAEDGPSDALSKVEAQRLYDDRIARMRLRQAFGRLVRRADDRGAFVLLDRRAPSRLFSAFPQGVSVQRLGLADTIRAVAEFLAAPPSH